NKEVTTNTDGKIATTKIGKDIEHVAADGTRVVDSQQTIQATEGEVTATRDKKNHINTLGDTSNDGVSQDDKGNTVFKFKGHQAIIKDGKFIPLDADGHPIEIQSAEQGRLVHKFLGALERYNQAQQAARTVTQAAPGAEVDPTKAGVATVGDPNNSGHL